MRDYHRGKLKKDLAQRLYSPGPKFENPKELTRSFGAAAEPGNVGGRRHVAIGKRPVTLMIQMPRHAIHVNIEDQHLIGKLSRREMAPFDFLSPVCGKA